MKTLKLVLFFLAVMLGLFMLVGMYYGALFFFFVLKIMGIAAVIAFLLYVASKAKTKNKDQ